MDSRHFIGVHGSRGRSGGSGWPRGSCPDYPSCLWETTPEGFSHFAHPGTQLSPLILPWLSPFFTLPGASSSPRTSLLFPFLCIFRSKHYSLLICTFPSTNTSLGHTQALSRPLQQFFHSPSPPHSHDFPGILFHNYHPSPLQLSNSHTCFRVPLSILNPHVCRTVQLLPAALLIRPPCTPVNISFARIPCPTFKNYFHFLSKGLLSPFHVPGPDLDPKTPLPTAQIPLLHPHSFQTNANPGKSLRPAITRLHRLPTSSLEPLPPHHPTAPLSCSSRAAHSGAVPHKRRVQGLREGAGLGERAQGLRGGGKAKGARGERAGRREDAWGWESRATEGGEETRRGGVVLVSSVRSYHSLEQS